MRYRVLWGTLALLIAAGPGEAAALSDFDKAILDAHNRERAGLGVPPLTWSDTLAADAAQWADHLVKLGHPQHSKPEERNHEGESLWVGTAGAYTPDEMVQGWIGEKSSFVYGTFPGVVKTGDWHVVGHYTQVVWRNTKEIGCAKASLSGGLDLLVCRYNPAGNLIGEKPY
jgi:uncharacterized protein YkwD